VSIPRSPAFSSCPHLSLPIICSPVRECPSLTGSLSVSSLIHPDGLPRRWVPLAPSLSFRLLTYSSRCALQEVSTPRSLAFFPCPHLSLPIRSPECECPSLARFPSMTPPVPPMRFPESECLRSLALFPCPHLSLVMRSLVRECPSLARSPSAPSLIPRSTLSRE